jgi:hypothetical protein
MTHFLLRRPRAVVATVFLSLLCGGLLAGPACAAEKEEEKVSEKAKPDVWDAKEEGRFFGIKRSSGAVGCTPATSLVLVDLAGSTFPDDVFSDDTTRLRVGGTDPTTDEGVPGRSSPRKSEPGGKALSIFSVIGRFP